MAKLFFKYSTMNAGKSTLLLQTSHNYTSLGMHTFLLTAKIDKRFGQNQITSRLGIKANAHVFKSDTNVFELIKESHLKNKLSCVLVDESQFLTKQQVYQLTNIVDKLNIPTICYGLKTDFCGNLFEGSNALLAWADKIEEIKTICFCSRKATHVVRLDKNGKAIKDGEQISIGDTNYKPLCRIHFKEALGLKINF
ncbi:MAG: thymidine kinase [Psittacicella sp.]